MFAARLRLPQTYSALACVAALHQQCEAIELHLRAELPGTGIVFPLAVLQKARVSWRASCVHRAHLWKPSGHRTGLGAGENGVSYGKWNPLYISVMLLIPAYSAGEDTVHVHIH